ncbi:hypothetical protein ABTM04_20380, partial [Acinetobacter baumannii]
AMPDLTSPTVIMPSSAPSDEDAAAWSDLSRDEQLRRLRQSLAQPDCSTDSRLSMNDVLSLAKAAGRGRRV